MPKPKKIVVDARRIRQSTGRVAREMLNELQKIDHANDYHVIIHDKDKGTWKPTAKNFTLHTAPYDHYTFGEQLGFVWYLYKMRADLVHFTMPQQPLLYFRRSVTTVHDLTLIRFKNLDKNRLIYNIEQLIFKTLLFIVAKRSKHIITDTAYVQDDLAKFARISKKKMSVAPCAANDFPKVTNKAYKPVEGKRYIMYVGNAFPHKNLQFLTDVFHDLKDPNLHLVMIGKKEFFYDQLQSYIDSKNYKNIHLAHGFQDDTLKWLYSHALVYVFPSLSEGFGLPGLEAMQFGVPVASSSATCLPEVYGDAALYFDPTSKSDTRAKISLLLSDRHAAKQLVAKGYKQVASYSWERTAKQTLAVYNKVLF